MSSSTLTASHWNSPTSLWRDRLRGCAAVALVAIALSGWVVVLCHDLTVAVWQAQGGALP